MVENRIKERRAELGVTQEWLSEKSGVPVSTVSDIEHGAEPRVTTAIKIAAALDTAVEKLWG